MQTTFFG